MLCYFKCAGIPQPLRVALAAFVPHTCILDLPTVCRARAERRLRFTNTSFSILKTQQPQIRQSPPLQCSASVCGANGGLAASLTIGQMQKKAQCQQVPSENSARSMSGLRLCVKALVKSQLLNGSCRFARQVGIAERLSVYAGFYAIREARTHRAFGNITNRLRE